MRAVSAVLVKIAKKCFQRGVQDDGQCDGQRNVQRGVQRDGPRGVRRCDKCK